MVDRSGGVAAFRAVFEGGVGGGAEGVEVRGGGGQG